MQLKRLVTQAGMLVADVADNGETAVEVVLREKPDMVLMDIRMPRMDGLQAAQRILETLPVCIVMLTAFSDESYQQQAKAIGASGYIIKPVTKETLLPQLRTAYQQFLER